MPALEEAWVKAYDTKDEDNFSQAGDLYRLMSEDQKNQLASNIAGPLSHANESIQGRMLEQFKQADADYANRVRGFLKKS